MHNNTGTHNDSTDFADLRPTRRQWLPKAVLLLLILFTVGLVRASAVDADRGDIFQHTADDQ